MKVGSSSHRNNTRLQAEPTNGATNSNFNERRNVTVINSIPYTSSVVSQTTNPQEANYLSTAKPLPNNTMIVESLATDPNYDVFNIDITAKDINGYTVIDIAIEQENLIAVCRLINYHQQILLQKNKHGEVTLCLLLQIEILSELLFLNKITFDILEKNIMQFLTDKGYNFEEKQNIFNILKADYTKINLY